MATTTTNPVLHHVTLKTNRLREMTDWYGFAFGLTPNHYGRFGAWLTNDAANHRLALLVAPGLDDDPAKITHTGMHHLAFEYPDIDALLAAYERLKAQGISPHACLDHGITTSMYYVDPDGNSVEVQTDNLGDWAASSEWMRTDPRFADNPIGVSFDPDQMLAAWHDGIGTEELHRRSFGGEFDPGTPLDLRLPAEADDATIEAI